MSKEQTDWVMVPRAVITAVIDANDDYLTHLNAPDAQTDPLTAAVSNLHAALIASPSPAGGVQGVTVKPLTWLDGVAIGAARLRYSVSKPSFTPGWRAWVQAIDVHGGAPVGGTIVTMTAADEDDAKAVCQTDYEARILSALSSQAQTTGGVDGRS